MLIVSAGFYRSGSTWMFNAIRLILDEFTDDYYSCWEQDYNPKNPAKYHLVKVHRWRPKLYKDAHLVFTSFRELEGIKGSMQRRADILNDERFSNETKFQHIDAYLVDLLKWQRKSNYFLWFRFIREQPVHEIEKIAGVLGMNVRCLKVFKRLNELKEPHTGFDPVTLIHANHITS